MLLLADSVGSGPLVRPWTAATSLQGIQGTEEVVRGWGQEAGWRRQEQGVWCKGDAEPGGVSKWQSGSIGWAEAASAGRCRMKRGVSNDGAEQ
jgi:hypothetical protein